MAKLRLYPHRTADPDAVQWGTWWHAVEGERVALPILLDGWDYASEVTLGLSPSVDVELLLDSTGQQDLSALELIVLADCKDAQERFVSRESLDGLEAGVSRPIALHLPAGQVAGSVKLSAHIVLGRDLPKRRGPVAHLKGARLASSDAVTLRLEGDAGRFPTEAAAFSELGFDSAPWTVLFSYSDLNDSFMGGVRLVINTEHPLGQLALDPKKGDKVAGLLRFDVMRSLLMRVALTENEAPTQVFTDGSVGDVLNSMSMLFLQRDLRSMARLIIEDLAAADRLLHDRLRPFEVVIG